MTEKRDFFNESALGSARGAHQYLTDPAFARPINSPPTRVDPMSIRPTVAELSSRDRSHVGHILTFSTIPSNRFPMLRRRGNCRFSRTHHAPVLHPSEPVPRLTSGPQRPLGRVQISTPHSRPFGLHGFANDVTLRADRQSDRESDRVTDTQTDGRPLL